MPFKMLLNMPLGLVSILYGLRGENFIVYPGADQAGICLEAAVRGIQAGRYERALAGGSAQSLSLMPLATMLRAGRLARVPAHAQPHKPEHNGLAPADMGAFLVLESAASAAARGARPLAEVDAVVLAPQPAPETRSDELAELWHRAAGHGLPDRVVSSGSRDTTEDRVELEACQKLGLDAAALVNFDGRLGYAGAAAPFLLMLLSALMTTRGTVPGAGLAFCAHPEGRHVVVRQSRPEELA
jgi:3-oxoacyl-[acyl-carrier-protein] synthase II